MTLRLAERHRLTLYDACYLEVALRRSLPLATLDSDLRTAALTEKVMLLEKNPNLLGIRDGGQSLPRLDQAPRLMLPQAGDCSYLRSVMLFCTNEMHYALNNRLLHAETITIRLGRKLKDKFTSAAKTENRSASEVLRDLMLAYVEDQEGRQFDAEARRESEVSRCVV